MGKNSVVLLQRWPRRQTCEVDCNDFIRRLQQRRLPSTRDRPGSLPNALTAHFHFGQTVTVIGSVYLAAIVPLAYG